MLLKTIRFIALLTGIHEKPGAQERHCLGDNKLSEKELSIAVPS